MRNKRSSLTHRSVPRLQRGKGISKSSTAYFYHLMHMQLSGAQNKLQPNFLPLTLERFMISNNKLSLCNILQLLFSTINIVNTWNLKIDSGTIRLRRTE